MQTRNNLGQKLTRNLGITLGLSALGLITLVSPVYVVSANEEIEEGVTNVTSEDLRDNAESYLDQTVTIRQPISETIGNTGFLLSENEDSEEIIVINATGEGITPPSEDIAIQVTGKVARLVVADVESQYGMDLEDDLYVDYVDRPVLIAQSLALAPNPEQIAANPSAFYDTVIAVEGDVRQVLSSNSLTLFEEGWIDDIGLLVIGVNSDFEAEDQRIDEGERIVVTGVASQEDVRSLNEKYSLGWEEDQITEFEARYVDRPVIIADGVYPSAVDE